MRVSKCSNNNVYILLNARIMFLVHTGVTRIFCNAIYNVLAKYLDHQTRIPRTQLQFWHSIRGIRQKMCICFDTVCDLMRLFETQADSSSTSLEEGGGGHKRQGRLRVPCILGKWSALSSFRKTNPWECESGQTYRDGNCRL